MQECKTLGISWYAVPQVLRVIAQMADLDRFGTKALGQLDSFDTIFIYVKNMKHVQFHCDSILLMLIVSSSLISCRFKEQIESASLRRDLRKSQAFGRIATFGARAEDSRAESL